MTGKEDVYRGPAIRALCRITDVSVLQLPVSYYCDYYFYLMWEHHKYHHILHYCVDN